MEDDRDQSRQGRALGPLRARLSSLLAVAKEHNGLWAFFILLLLVDLAFAGTYAVTRAMRALEMDPGLLGSPRFRITAEGGYAEFFNYAKIMLVVFFAGRLGGLTRQPVYAALAIVYAMILFDDSLAIHETVGELLVDAWALQPVLGIRAQDQGELLTWAFLGAIGTGILFWGFRRSGGLHVEIGGLLLLPIVALVIFGIGVDILYGVAKDAFPGAGLLLDTTEEGGEMIATTAACALTGTAFCAFRHHAIGWEPSGQQPGERDGWQQEPGR